MPPLRQTRQTQLKTAPKTCHSEPNFTPAQRRKPPVNSTVRHLSDASSQQSHTPPPAPCPSTLVIGDSIVWNIKMRSAETHCFPGAKVADILGLLPIILTKHCHVQNVIIHAGCNDIPNQTSEILKRNFSRLWSFLKNTVKQVISSHAPFLLSRQAMFVLAGPTQLASISLLTLWCVFY